MKWIDVSLEQGDVNHILQNIDFDNKEEVYDTIEYLIVKCVDLLDEANELKDRIDVLLESLKEEE